MNIVIIGSAGHWNFVFENFDSSRHAIVAIAPGGEGESMEHVMGACQQHGQNPSIHADFYEALNVPGVDVIVSNPRYDRNVAVLLAAVERGIPCFAEKPFAITDESLNTLHAAWESSSTVLYPMMSLRAESSFYTAWKMVQAGQIGTPRLITAQKSYRLGQRPDFFRDRAKMGGLIPWVGSHVVDLVYWFTRQPFRHVMAHHSSAHNQGYGDLEIASVIQFGLEDGTQVNLNLDYLRPARAESHGDDRIRIAGTEAVLEVQNERVWLINENGTTKVDLMSPPRLFADFCETITGQSSLLMGPEDGFVVTNACLKARQSADDGSLLHLN